MSFTITIHGHPATQGSKRHVGGGRMIEMDRKLPAWREAINKAVNTSLGDGWEPVDGPLVCTLDVFLPAPVKSRFGAFPAGPPDLDKLQRAAGDSLTQSGAITDDARIVKWIAQKHWAVGFVGAVITIRQAGEL